MPVHFSGLSAVFSQSLQPLTRNMSMNLHTIATTDIYCCYKQRIFPIRPRDLLCAIYFHLQDSITLYFLSLREVSVVVMVVITFAGILPSLAYPLQMIVSFLRNVLASILSYCIFFFNHQIEMRVEWTFKPSSKSATTEDYHI